MNGLIFTWGLAYGGALFSLVHPFYGLLIYICFATIRPEYLWFWSLPAGGNYSRIVATALLAGWFLKGFGSWQFRQATPIAVALIGYFVWQALSAFNASDQAVAWAQVELQGKIVLPCVIGLTLVDSAAKLRMTAWVLVLSQGYVAWEANLGYWGGNNWLRESGFGGMDNNSICIAMVAIAGLAFFLGIGETTVWRKWLAFTAAGLMAHCAMFGTSRGGMLALIVTGIVSFLLIPKQPKHYVMFLLAVIVALRLAGPLVVERFSTVFASPEARDVAAQSRLDLWTSCWDSMQRHPLLGVGPDHWPLVAPNYGWPKGKECHSVWFNAATELGIPGLALLLAFFGITIWKTWRMWSVLAAADPFFAHVGRMVIASICGYVVAASFVSLDNLEPPYYVTMLGAGMIKLASEHQRS